MHRGQREAGLAVGLTPHQVFVHVVLPQALRVMLPPLVNCYVALLKDSSLCALIATDELMLAARAMSSEYFLPLHIFVLVGPLLLCIAFPLSMLSRHSESASRVAGAPWEPHDRHRTYPCLYRPTAGSRRARQRAVTSERPGRKPVARVDAA